MFPEIFKGNPMVTKTIHKQVVELYPPLKQKFLEFLKKF